MRLYKRIEILPSNRINFCYQKGVKMDKVEETYRASWAAFHAIDEAKDRGATEEELQQLEKVWREKKNEYLIAIGKKPIVHDDTIKENEES
jgi:hypothetical protein